MPHPIERASHDTGFRPRVVSAGHDIGFRPPCRGVIIIAPKADPREKPSRAKSRPLGVREVQTIEYRLYRTIEPKQRGAGARISSDARRVCDASGQEVGTPERMRPGRKGSRDAFGEVIVFRECRENSDKRARTVCDTYLISPPLPPRYAALRGPLPSPEGTAFWGFTVSNG